MANSAFSSLLSNSTNSVPASTNSPSSKWILLITFDDLEVMSIDSLALAVPNAVNSSLKLTLDTSVVTTSIGEEPPPL